MEQECNHNFVEEDNVEVCIECGLQKEERRLVSSYSQNVKLKNRYQYSREDNFRHILDAYLCVENFKAKEKYIIFFKKYFLKTNLAITRENIHNIIRARHKKNPKAKWNLLYKHINYIYLELTGKKPDSKNISRDRLIFQFNMLVNEFERLRKLNFKSNFISYQLTLYELLLMNKVNPDREFFRFLKNKATLNRHMSYLRLLMHGAFPSYTMS